MTDGSKRTFHVPDSSGASFVGRDALLADLAEDFAAPLATDPGRRVQALYGMPGVGKTRVAAEFARRYGDRFGVVGWLRAEEPATLAVDYADLGRALGLPIEGGAPTPQAVAAVRAHLSGRDDYLLVFDNAGGPDDLGDYVPRPCGGAILITSRNPNWGGLARPAAVHGLTRDESVAFLRRRTGRTDHDATARRLAQALGDLPLALEQAAALIARAEWSFAEYLSAFEALYAEILARGRVGGVHRLEGDYPDAVAMSWELSVRRAAAEDASAVRLLDLLAFLSPDGVPREMLCAYLADLPEDLSMTVAEPTALDRALRTLDGFSLVQLQAGGGGGRGGDESTVSLHRLAGAMTRDRMTEDQRRMWAGAAARLVAGAFAFDSADAATWPVAAQVLPHALAAATHAQSAGVPVEITCALLDRAGRFLNRFARYAQAKDLLDRAMALSRRAYGDESPRVSAIANDLGRVLARLGQRDLARQHFEWALAIDRNAYGDADPHAASVMNNYANVLQAGGQLESARENLEAALAIFEQAYGAAHPKVAALLNNLGCLHQSAGDHASAVELFERALGVAAGALGDGHPTTGSIWHNLGKSWRETGDDAAARDAFDRALAIHRAALGDDHPDVARDRAAIDAMG
jgi:tetratricopeptide (TPR) repeat protein